MTINYRAIRAARGGTKDMPYRAGLVAWYRYRYGIINTNGNCTRWRDQSGNGNDLVQDTASLGPAVQSDGSLLFNGSSQYMQATFTLNQPATIFMAFTQVSWTNNNVILDGKTAQAQLIQTSSTPQITVNAGSALTADATIPVGSRGVCAVVFNNTASSYVAGGGAATVTTSGTAGSNNLGGFTLGAARTPASYSNIQVREVAIFNQAYTADQILKNLRYFARVGQVGGV